jgi:hypothetical protein
MNKNAHSFPAPNHDASARAISRSIPGIPGNGCQAIPPA